MNNNHTIYENLSQNQLTALFSSENWDSLSFSERMNACQEVENRYAAENNVEPCTVRHQPMEDACYGWQSGQTICLNTYLVRDGQFCSYSTDQNGNKQEVRVAALAPGWNTLDTVYHEGTHGVQESTGRAPYTYISSDMDGDLYRIQEVEKEAYVVGQLRALEALSNYEKEVGHLDASRSEYLDSVRADSFKDALIDAARNYNDPNIEQTLKDFINDRENNITRENQSESYKAISDLYDSQIMKASADRTQAETPAVANPQNTNPSISASPEASSSNDNNSHNSQKSGNVIEPDDIMSNEASGNTENNSLTSDGVELDDGMSNEASKNTENNSLTNDGIELDDGMSNEASKNTENNSLTNDGAELDDGMSNEASENTENNSQIYDDGFESPSDSSSLSDGMDTETPDTASEIADDGFSDYESNGDAENSGVVSTTDDGFGSESESESSGPSSEPDTGASPSASDDMSNSD